MGWFNTKIKQVSGETKTINDAMKSATEEIEAINDIIKSTTEEIKAIDNGAKSATEKPKEEWIWVEGYKGTDKNMKCRDFQYELDVQYDMPEEKTIECVSGFHLCLKLDDVFNYYEIGKANRFFKVKALVRKTDVEQYGNITQSYLQFYKNNKLVAKSIIFISELTQNEILKGTEVELLSQKYKDLAIKCGIKETINVYHKNTLIEDGYSKAFANYIVSNSLFDKAHAVGSMKSVSMDMKVLFILRAK